MGDKLDPKKPTSLVSLVAPKQWMLLFLKDGATDKGGSTFMESKEVISFNTTFDHIRFLQDLNVDAEHIPRNHNMN